MFVGTHQDGGDHGAGHHQHDRVEVRRCKVESGELRTWGGGGTISNFPQFKLSTFADDDDSPAH